MVGTRPRPCERGGSGGRPLDASTVTWLDAGSGGCRRAAAGEAGRAARAARCWVPGGGSLGVSPRGWARTPDAASCAQREPLWLLLQVGWREVCLVGLCPLVTLCWCPQVLGVEISVLMHRAYGWAASALLRGFEQCT